jgi:hypothetical protein
LQPSKQKSPNLCVSISVILLSTVLILFSLAFQTFPGHWLKITGTNVTLRGTTNPKWGWIDSHGQQWWDAVQQTNRPHGINFQVTNGVVKDMKLWQPVAWNFALNGGKNVHVYNNRIHAVSSTKVGFFCWFIGERMELTVFPGCRRSHSTRMGLGLVVPTFSSRTTTSKMAMTVSQLALVPTAYTSAT